MLFWGGFQLKNALQSVLERIGIFTVLYWCIFVCYFSATIHTGVRFNDVFFNMHSFTKFIIFINAPCLFTNTILLEHGYLYQRTMHCPLLACVCSVPCFFHFQVIHRLLSNHTAPACGVVPNSHATMGDGLIDHKTVNTEWWFVNTTQVCQYIIPPNRGYGNHFKMQCPTRLF